MPYIDFSLREELNTHIESRINDLNRRPLSETDMVKHLSQDIARIAIMGENYSLEDDYPIGRLIAVLNERQQEKQNVTGQQNYSICRLLLEVTKLHSEPSYSKIHFVNVVLRAAEREINLRHVSEYRKDCCAALIDDVRLEIYRRWSSVYEENKKNLNGDVV
jgi:hypothetical protein